MSYVCRCPLTPRVLALGGWALEARVPSKSWFDLPLMSQLLGEHTTYKLRGAA